MDFTTTEVTRQMLTAACAVADDPAGRHELLKDLANDAAARPDVADIAQQLALVAGMALDKLATNSGFPRSEVLAAALGALAAAAGEDDDGES